MGLATVALAGSASSSTASAEESIALSRFEPAERGSRLFRADALELGAAVPAGLER